MAAGTRSGSHAGNATAAEAGTEDVAARGTTPTEAARSLAPKPGARCVECKKSNSGKWYRHKLSDGEYTCDGCYRFFKGNNHYKGKPAPASEATAAGTSAARASDAPGAAAANPSTGPQEQTAQQLVRPSGRQSDRQKPPPARTSPGPDGVRMAAVAGGSAANGRVAKRRAPEQERLQRRRKRESDLGRVGPSELAGDESKAPGGAGKTPAGTNLAGAAAAATTRRTELLQGVGDVKCSVCGCRETRRWCRHRYESQRNILVCERCDDYWRRHRRYTGELEQEKTGKSAGAAATEKAGADGPEGTEGPGQAAAAAEGAVNSEAEPDELDGDVEEEDESSAGKNQEAALGDAAAAAAPGGSGSQAVAQCDASAGAATREANIRAATKAAVAAAQAETALAAAAAPPGRPETALALVSALVSHVCAMDDAGRHRLQAILRAAAAAAETTGA